MDRFTEAFRTELAAFVEVTKGGPVLGATVADAVEVAWLAEAATESLRRGAPVTIAEVRNAMSAPSRSPGHRSRGASARYPAGATSWTASGC